MRSNLRLSSFGFGILALGLVTSFLLAGNSTTQNVDAAAKASDFNAGNIIDDAVFYNKDAMTLAEIEEFLQKNTTSCDTWGTKAIGKGRYIGGKAVDANISRAEYAKLMREAGNTRYHAPPYVCLTNYYENPKTRKTSHDTNAERFEGSLSAAEIIYKAAQDYGINPQVLLVTLRKEYSYAFTDEWPLKDQYNTMMGYGCPDTGPGNTANCDSKYYGFYNQVMKAAWQFNYYKNHIGEYNYQPGRENIISYSPNAACGYKKVYIENVATASLYIYTPYTPNAATLAAWPGTANCGAYGNRNFFMFFNEWFGSTHGRSYWGELESARHLTTINDIRKINPLSGAADGQVIKTGTVLYFNSKLYTDGENCLRTEYDAAKNNNLCIPMTSLAEVDEWAWQLTENPRTLIIAEVDTPVIDSVTRKHVDTLEKGSSRFFSEKTTLTDGTMCLRLGGNLCVNFNDLDEVANSWEQMLAPRLMQTWAPTDLIDLSSNKTIRKINQGTTFLFSEKITLNGTTYLKTADPAIDNLNAAIEISNLMEAWNPMERPRNLIVLGVGYKINPYGNGEELKDLLLTPSMVRVFKEKIFLGDGSWCLKTEYDISLNRDRCIRDSLLGEY